MSGNVQIFMISLDREISQNWYSTNNNQQLRSLPVYPEPLEVP